MTKNNIPVGYKDSVVGVIPWEWEVKKIEEICEIYVGKDVRKGHFKETLDDKYKYPVYSNTVENKGLYGYYDYEEYEENTVTVVGRGVGLGTAFARDNGHGAIGRLIVLKPYCNMNNHFLANCINTQVHFYVESAAIPQLTGEQIATYKVVQPSIEEQQKIVEILRTWDEAIEKQSKLINALEKRKKALMQRLLTGRVRLPGFTREWKTVKLGDIGKFESGCVFSEKEQGGKIGIPFYKVSDMNLYGNETHMTNANNYVTYEQISRLKLNVITEESIIFAKVGAAIALERKRHAKNFIIDNNMLAFIPNQNILYMKYWFDNTSLSKYIQVGALPSYNASDLAVIKLNLPPLEEQIAIANILVSSDNEIKQHNTKLNQLRKQKQGLMQQLLTGKKRVKI